MNAPRPRRPFAFLVLLLILSSSAAAACTGLVGPEGWASPVQSGDLLLAAHEDKLFAFDPSDLEARWVFPGSSEANKDVDPEALYGTPAVLDDTIYVPGYDDRLYALDPEAGEVRWSFRTDGPIVGGVVASEDGIYFGSSDGNVYALNATGSEKWPKPFETGKEVQSTPTLVDGTLYVTSLDGRLYALDTSNGEERWSFKTGAGVASTPVVDEAAGMVYVGGFDSRLRAVDLETHEERWSVEADNWFWTKPVVAGGAVFAGSLDSKVYAVDVESGEDHWAQPFKAGAPVRSAPVVVGGTLIIVDRDGHVFGLEPDSGEAAGDTLALEADVLTDPLVVAGPDGTEVIVVTTDGELVRIDPASLTVIGRKELS